jgi:hypothetical protein
MPKQLCYYEALGVARLGIRAALHAPVTCAVQCVPLMLMKLGVFLLHEGMLMMSRSRKRECSSSEFW